MTDEQNTETTTTTTTVEEPETYTFGGNDYSVEDIEQALLSKSKFEEASATLEGLSPLIESLSRKDRKAFDAFAKSIFGDDTATKSNELTAYEARLAAIEAKYKETENAQATDKALASARKKYGDEFDEEATLQFMQKNGLKPSQIDIAHAALKAGVYKESHTRFKQKKNEASSVLGENTSKNKGSTESKQYSIPGETLAQAAARLGLKL